MSVLMLVGVPVNSFAGHKATTWALGLALIGAGVLARKPIGGLAAALAWTFGNEGVYMALSILLHHNPQAYLLGWRAFWIDAALTIIGLLFCRLFRIGIDWRPLLAAVVLWGVWLLDGFHSNVLDLRYAAEDVATKTALGLAFLWPLLGAAYLSVSPWRINKKSPGPSLAAGAGTQAL